MEVPSGGAPPEGDWEATWAKQAVTSEEWDALRSEIRERYERAVAWMARNEAWSVEDAPIMFLAPLPHVAYHLGAMRVLLNLVSP